MQDRPGPARPTVVLVTGEPGSGKTTLGQRLARHLSVPFVARDDVRRALYLTAGAWRPEPPDPPPADDATDTFLALVEAMVGLGISCVVEYVVRRERPDHLARLAAGADCVVVRTTCRDAAARRATRDATDPLLVQAGRAGVVAPEAARLAHMDAVTAAMATEFDQPVLEVATDAGYDPSFDEIVAFVVAPR